MAYTVALGLFLAVGRETTGKIPPGKVKYHVEEGTVSQCALGEVIVFGPLTHSASLHPGV